MNKPSLKDYFAPTPSLFTKIGDALLLISGSITTYAVAEEHKLMALIALWVGIAGKVFTNFFKEPPQQTHNA